MRRRIAFFNQVERQPKAGGVTQFSANLRESLGALEEVTVNLATPPAHKEWINLAKSRFVNETILAHDKYLLCNHDLFYFPNYFIPPSLTRKRPFCVTTVHDLQYKHLPHLFSKRRRAWLDLCHVNLARARCGVVFISESTRQDFIRFFGAPFKHTVIYNGASMPSAQYGRVPAGRFLLASYHYYPHKNFDGVLSLFSKLKRDGYPGQLLITGHGREQVLSEMRKHGDLVDFVSHLGFVERDELAGLYQRCDAFVSLSRFEGFNMSAAEAALAGASLILSDIPVHRELFSDVALFLDLESPDLRAASAFVASSLPRSAPWKMANIVSNAQSANSYLEFFNQCVGKG